MRSSSRFSASVGLVAALSLAVACAGGGSATAGASAGAVTVTAAWARPSLGTDQPTAAYLTVTNMSGQADTLISASSPAATSVEMHQTSTDMSGMTGMDMMSSVDVAPGATVKMEPGGMHLMISGLTRALNVGDTLELHLVFQHAGTIVVRAEVRQG